MRKIKVILTVIALCFMVLGCSSPVKAESFTSTQLLTAKSTVNVRAENTTKSAKLGTLKKGTSVEVIGKTTNNWYVINFNNKTGYVLSKYLISNTSVTSVYTPNPLYIETVHEEEIKAEGIKNKYTFLYLTDNHLVVKSDSDSTEVQAESNKLIGFTNSSGINSIDAFPYWIEYANNKNVNALLMGGDMLSYPTRSGIDFMKQQLATLKTPYLYTLGNHDWSFSFDYHSQYSKDEYKPLYNDFTSVLEYDDLIVLTIDNSSNQVEQNSLDTFQYYFNKNKPMILVMHVPLMTDSVSEQSKKDWGSNLSIGGDGIVPNDVTSRFLNLLYAENSPVICVLSGHTHFYNKSTLPKEITQIVGDDGYGGSGLLLTVSPK
jgi:hypothetical protein